MRWWALLAIVAIVSSLLAFTVFGGLSTDVADENFTELYWLTMLGVMLNVLTVGAWAYLTGQAIAGRRADEDPSLGWFLAAFSGACILALFLVSGVTTAMVSIGEVNPPAEVSTVPRRCRPSPISRCSPRSPSGCRRRTRRSTTPRTRPARTASAGPTTPTEAIAAPDDLAGSTA